MSKILHITDNAFIPKQQQNVGNNDGGEFKSALENALGSPHPTVSKQEGTNSLGEIPSTPGLSPIGDSDSDVIDKTNFLLDKLENFSKDLEDPEKSLKDIEPLITSIKDDAENLILESTQTEDETLNKIATETAVKASTEYEKFNRGDYI